jgi:hypothetical protein
LIPEDARGRYRTETLRNPIPNTPRAVTLRQARGDWGPEPTSEARAARSRAEERRRRRRRR